MTDNMASRIRVLEHDLTAHIATCAERKKQVDEMIRKIDHIESTLTGARGARVAISVLVTAIVSIITCGVSVFALLR